MKNAEHDKTEQDTPLFTETKIDEKKSKGRLKIFFGMAPGVGKTSAMLQDAKTLISRGSDVIAISIDHHGHYESEDLLYSLQQSALIKDNKQPFFFEKVDIEAVLKRNPNLVLVDEAAHVNPEGSCHAKRYQDIVDLIDNGIDVYTTANVMQLESQTDNVKRITGLVINDTFPDEIFEKADEVVLIDMSPDELSERFNEGKIIDIPKDENIHKAFNKTALIELREISFRLVTNHINNRLYNRMKQKNISGPMKSGPQMLVLVGPSTSSAKLIRQARNMSYTMGAKLIALHVDNTQVLNEIQKEQLSKNIDSARRFGAKIVMTSGNNLVDTTLEIARKENVTHIVIGKSGKQSFLSSLFFKEDFVNQLLKKSGPINIYVIEPGFEAKQYKRKLFSYPDFSSSYKSYLMATLAVICTGLLCFPISKGIGYQSVSFIMLFVVLILSMFFRLGPVLLASAISAISWNFFLIPPELTFKVSKPSDLLAFGTFFIVAIVTGLLTAKVRKQEVLNRKREEKTNALFSLINALAETNNTKEVLETAKTNVKKYFGKNTFFLLQDGTGILKKKKPTDKLKDFSNADYSIAQWVFDNAKKAGKFTETLTSSDYTFYPLRGQETSLGVVLVKQDEAFSGETELFWNTFLIQISNALEHLHFTLMAKNVKIMTEHDKVYRAFFESIFSDLNMPLKAMSETACKIHENPNKEKNLVKDMMRYSVQLRHLTGNLLTLSKLESSGIELKTNWCDISELFGQIAEDMKGCLKFFPLQTDIVSPMPLVKIDEKLIKQVLYNVVYNSCKYSKEGAEIFLKAYYKDNTLTIQEMDRGTGFLPDALNRAFDKFYKSGNIEEEGLGIGLFIAKSLIEMHNGTIGVENRQNGGARLTINIPAESSFANIQALAESEE